jgi:sulfur carrier protein ThiS
MTGPIMVIHVKLMGSLRARLSAEVPGGKIRLEVPPGSTVADALDQLGISTGQVHLVMVNGEMETERGRTLAEGDEVQVFPPVAGG